MDDRTDSVSENCIIVSPEELAKLGVKLENMPLSTSSENDSNLKYAERQEVEESMDSEASNISHIADNIQDQTSFASCSRTKKVINNCQDRLEIVWSPSENNIVNRIGPNKYKKISNDTKSNAKGDSTFFYNNDSSNKTMPSSSSISLQSPVQIRGRGRLKQSLPPVINEDNVDVDVSAVELPFDQDLEVKNKLESLKGNKDKINVVETSKLLLENDIENSHSSSENKVCKKFLSVDDLKSRLEDAPSPSTSELGTRTTNNGVPKRGRGRPRKSLLNMSSQSAESGDIGRPDNISDNSIELTSNRPKEISINGNKSFNETSDLPQSFSSRTVRRGKIKNYGVIESDLDSNSDSNYDIGSGSGWKGKTKKRKKGVRKNIRIIDSDSSSDISISIDEFMPQQKHAKIEHTAMHSNSVPIHNDINVPLEIVNKSICEKNKTPKKRGRPKKNSLDNKTVVSSTLVKEHSEMDNSVITTSKRGRKRKEVNYLLLQNPDFSEQGSNNETIKSTASKINGRPKISLEEHVEKKAEHDLSHDVKLEDDSILYPSVEIVYDEENSELLSSITEEQCDAHSSDVNEGNSTSSTQASSRYKWTGNVTKAINQMFNGFKDNSITNSDHDPLLGKIKRKGRPKERADYLLDEDGSSLCMVCNETVPNPQWPKHKRKVHYNLAWRKGDFSLDLTNEDFVLKTLKQLAQRQGFIKCNRCAQKITNGKKFASHLELCNGVVNSSGCVTCAVCKTAVEKSAWKYHNYRQHNNLSWREGDPPLNLEDQDLVLRILNGLYKERKPLHCEKCGLQKKSVLGFLSHKTTCQKTEDELENLKIACELCDKKILPVSMDYHLKSHKEKELKESALYSDYFDVNLDITGKRKAAQQALQVIKCIRGQAIEESKYYSVQCDFQEVFVSDILRKQLRELSSLKCIFAGCDYTTDVVESMAHHMNSCDKKPDQYFVCKLCLSSCKEESEIHEHIKTEHNKSFKGNDDMEFQSEEQNNSEDDILLDDEDREKKRLRLIGKQKLINQANVKIKPLFLVHPIRETPSLLLYRQAYVWMLEFCDINYQLNLYQYLRNVQPWQALDCDLLIDYLPKNSQSCDIAAKVITSSENSANFDELSFRKLDLFEVSDLYEGDITIYCGGPISALAWLPTPYAQNLHNQVLAVAVFKSMESYYSMDKNYHEPCVIQFWDFGILNCHEINVSKPTLLFGMAVTCGPIWHLEWCPSGCLDCFQEDTTCRIGLLAIAASDSFVYIYSIDNLPDVNDRGFIYKGEPVLKLQLETEASTLEGQAYYPTKISWSKAAGHRYIAVGFSTGLIALYDLVNESLLLKRGDQTGTNIVFSYNSFQAHYTSITALTLSHLNGGNRFLFSASFDRTSLFWDLNSMNKITPCKRNTVSDGVWMTQWPTYLVAEDESSFNNNANAHTFYRALRYLMSPDVSNFTFAVSGIKALSFSDWLNTILHGSNAGEVMAQFSHRLFCNIETKVSKTNYKKCIFALTKLIKKDSSDQHIARTYEEAAKKYKVAFLDYSLENIDNTLKSTAKTPLRPDNLSMCDLREYSLQSINKIAFNPNPQACSFYAIGYQAGFVRLHWLQFLSSLLKNY